MRGQLESGRSPIANRFLLRGKTIKDGHEKRPGAIRHQR
jgi:hypothetical protein